MLWSLFYALLDFLMSLTEILLPNLPVEVWEHWFC